MGQLQPGREVIGAATPALSQKQARAKRRWQVWHCLIPGLAGFGILFGAIIVASGFSFLVISALAIVVAMSTLVVALAWAFQNNV